MLRVILRHVKTVCRFPLGPSEKAEWKGEEEYRGPDRHSRLIRILNNPGMGTNPAMSFLYHRGVGFISLKMLFQRLILPYIHRVPRILIPVATEAGSEWRAP